MHEGFFEKHGIEWKQYGEYLIDLIADFIERLHRLEVAGEQESVSRRKCIFCNDAGAVELKIATNENYEASKVFLRCDKCGWTKRWDITEAWESDESWKETFLNPAIFLKRDDVVTQN